MAPMHALMLPFPQQGHINPLMQLAQHLAACHGFLITFVNTEYNHARLNTRQGTGSANYPMDLVALPDGLPSDAERNVSNMGRLLWSMSVHMQPRLEDLIHDINQSSTPLSCIIADVFLPWVPPLARRSRIPAVLGIHTSSIGFFSLLYHIPLLLSTGQVNPDGTVKGNLERFSGIPGLGEVPISVVPWLAGDDVARIEPMFRALGTVQADVAQLDGILFNSFAELEGESVEGLVNESSHSTSHAIVMAPVGPTLLLERQAEELVQTSSGKLDEGCLEWLQRQAERTVLYVAFGTTARLSSQDLQALALGLEACKVPFLWVLRSDLQLDVDKSIGHTATEAGDQRAAHLPDGFLARTKAWACFTSWAPQTLVLSHPSVAAFLTHGGWNSIIEAISTGVPLLTWPYFGDQKFQVRQVEEEWQVGLPLRPRDGKAVQQEDVERLVRSVMSGPLAEQLRARCSALRSQAKLAAARDSGSSFRHLRDIIQLVKSKTAAL